VALLQLPPVRVGRGPRLCVTPPGLDLGSVSRPRGAGCRVGRCLLPPDPQLTWGAGRPETGPLLVSHPAAQARRGLGAAAPQLVGRQRGAGAAAASGQGEAEALHRSRSEEPQPACGAEREPSDRSRGRTSASLHLWQTWLRVGVRPACSGLVSGARRRCPAGACQRGANLTWLPSALPKDSARFADEV